MDTKAKRKVIADMLARLQTDMTGRRGADAVGGHLRYSDPPNATCLGWRRQPACAK
jgi:hypothetical protein